MNLFRPALARESFDVVLCNGVLHHTSEPYEGFQGLIPLVKPGGFFVLGLYNRFGRLLTDARRAFFRVTKNRYRWVDPIHRAMGPSNLAALEDKRRAWFADQYCHPHESKHSFGEVLQWFDKNDIEFIRGVPSVTPRTESIEDACLFDPRPRGNALHHFLAQMREVVAGSREGGFFVMIGRKSR
jgi:SAM-dependent methyltransferase